MRTNVYIDGFNLFYGCLRGTPYRWLDLRALCQGLLPGHQVHRIRYFTAKVTGRNDPAKLARQESYLQALQTIPELSIHLGHYLEHTVRMRLATPMAGQPPSVEVLKSEEKGSDVNLACYLLTDGFENDYEQALVVSNDSDLKKPIEMVRQKLNRPVGIALPVSLPNRNPSRVLIAASAFQKHIRTGLLSKCQFADLVNGSVKKPARW
jgi:hypothetical protein